MDTVLFSKEKKAVVILDQTALPQERRYLHLTTLRDVWFAIKKLQVRGAPAIGVAAAMGICVHMRGIDADTTEAFAQSFNEAKDFLLSARPTAVNLHWALERMSGVFESCIQQPHGQIISDLCDAAQAIRDEDEEVCKKIGKYGAALLTPGMGVLTHCNAGALATCGCGTALAPVYTAHARGVPLRVYTDETRPLLQGARLTTYELLNAGVDTTLICDNMASHVMQKGWVDAVFVGCDRVAANGDTANKIGTSGVAILAAAYGIPFYICAPFSTIDTACADGSGIIIEERDASEITELWYKTPMAPTEGLKVFNPSFDVTPARYITAFITERGIIKPPYNFNA